jgi:hypothetical protein
MSVERAIVESIQRISGTQLSDKTLIYSATVDSVDLAARTCNVTTLSSQGEMTIEGVQLMASVDDGLLLVPVIDSTVIVTYTTFNKPFISLFSAIEKTVLIVGDNNVSFEMDNLGILLEIANTKLSVKDGITQFNDGSLGGLVKIIDLTTKLNNLENKVNALLSAFNTHTHILTLTSGTGTAAPTTSPVTGTLTPTVRGDIEDTKITH